MNLIVLLFGLAGLDICLKDRIEKEEPAAFPRDLEGSNGKVKLYQNHNDGFSFGILKDKPELVRMVPLIFTSALGGIFGWLSMHGGKRLEKASITFALAGALSNLYDRLTRNYVVDYLSVQSGRLKKVVFNLGDVWILVGSVLLVASEVFDEVAGQKTGKGRKH